MANYFLSSAHPYHPCADSGGRRRTHAVSPCSHPRATASEDNAALGHLTGKPAGTRPDYRGCWCAVSRGHPGRPNLPSPRATLDPWERPSTVSCGIAWTRDIQTIERILHSTWSAFTGCATREPPYCGAPQRGAAGYEEGGGRGTTCPRSNFAAGVDQHAVGRATTGRGADSMASHGPSEASLTSPRLCPGLLDF
ncbi:UNVERIFIED_CONTAM: hypothetical protein FKN15_057249 [Acipenser sinensis]